jgi:polysaccharide biosynthesis protein PelC
MKPSSYLAWSVVLLMFSLGTGCAGGGPNVYHDRNMDFGAIQAVAVMPFSNHTRESAAAERVRDVFVNKLLSTGALYVLPVGEVARAVVKNEIANPATPSPEEIVKLGAFMKVQAVITGTVREYGDVRTGTTTANVISVSSQMIETQTGRVVWSSSSSKGGVTVSDRLFGGGGKAMEKVTAKAVDDLLEKLFK